MKKDQALDGDLGIKRFPTAATDVGTQDIHLCVAYCTTVKCTEVCKAARDTFRCSKSPSNVKYEKWA